MAYTYQIDKNTPDSHQTSPAWMLTFVRWANRSPKNIQSEKPLAVRAPMVVINDCISVEVTSSKSSHTPHMSATLVAGDINYMTAIAPGDFVFVNMVEFEAEISDKKNGLYIKAQGAKSPLNGFHDGFKGLFKVQSVRRVVQIEPSTGAKQVFFQVEGFAFTEFNTSIYFNPHLIAPGDNKTFIFVTNIGTIWDQILKIDKVPSTQAMVKFFIESFLGQGVSPEGQKAGDSGLKKNFNTHYYVPEQLGPMMGQPNAKAAKDLFVYLMGVQQYSGSAGGPESGFNPSNMSKVTEGRFYLGPECPGRAVPKAEYWNQTPVWSILQQYLNSPINECYNAFKVSRSGFVLPTFVMRQIPFSSEKYKGESTKFLSLPRWKVSHERITSINIGREEAARINFVQVFGQAVNTQKPDAAISQQIASGNYDLDEDDIRRSGLRPYVISSNFDALKDNVIDENSTNAVEWSKLLGDALIGGHLKLNGSVSCAGIQEPIAPGDNFELENVVFHIESVSHRCQISGDGRKTFETTLELSHGVSSSSTKARSYYPQMDNVQIEPERQRHHDSGYSLGGFSDEQHLPGKRESGVKTSSASTEDILQNSKEPTNKVDKSNAKSKTNKKRIISPKRKGNKK